MPVMNGERPSPSAIERDLFLAALELPTLAERATYLDRACGADASLRAAVEALLQNHKDDNFLETPVIEVPPDDALKRGPSGTVRITAVIEKTGDRIGVTNSFKRSAKAGAAPCTWPIKKNPSAGASR